MMNKQEHYLTCLAEECNEVAQRVSKALRFGLAEVQDGQGLNNAERISVELNDLLAVAEILHEMGVIPAYQPTVADRQAKFMRIEKFMPIGRKHGALQ